MGKAQVAMNKGNVNFKGSKVSKVADEVAEVADDLICGVIDTFTGTHGAGTVAKSTIKAVKGRNEPAIPKDDPRSTTTFITMRSMGMY